MGWARVDDEYPRHGKIQSIPPAVRADAIALELAALCYSTRLLTDGYIGTAVVQSLGLEVGFQRYKNGRESADLRRLQRAISALESVQRWVPQTPSGWYIHDFDQYQPSASEVKARRQKEAEKKRRQRAQERMSLDLSPGDSDRDVPPMSPGDSPGDVSRERGSGARAPARPVPSPGGTSSAPPGREKPDLATPRATHRSEAALRAEARSEDERALPTRAECPICGPLHNVGLDFELADHLRNVHDVEPEAYLERSQGVA